MIIYCFAINKFCDSNNLLFICPENYRYLLHLYVMLALFTPKLLKRFLDFFWWLVVGSVILLVLYVLYILLFSRDQYMMGLLRIPLFYQGVAVPELDFGSHMIALTPKKLQGTLEIFTDQSHGFSHPLLITALLFRLLEYTIIVGIFYQARQFMRKIVGKNFFVPANINRLKWMGHLFFASMLLFIFEMAVVRIYMFHNRIFLPDKVSYDTGEVWTSTFDGLLSVFICYMFAGIFQYGMKLREEQELTV